MTPTVQKGRMFKCCQNHTSEYFFLLPY